MTIEIFNLIAEREIQEAIEDGKFDDLPGKGKPIVFEEDASIPFAQRMANKVLQNAGVLPEWIQAQKDLKADQAQVVALRTRITAENIKRRDRCALLPPNSPELESYREWRMRVRETYYKRLKAVNGLLVKLSLIAPQSVSLPGLYKIEDEMRAFEADFAPISAENSAK